MDKFWTMVRINPAGGYRVVLLPQIMSYALPHVERLGEQSPGSSGVARGANRALFRQLMQDFWAGSTEAQLSLRCYVSHMILQECKAIAKQFGTTHQFGLSDILPIVLDDAGHLNCDYVPNSLKILQCYDPDAASLTTWASRLTRQNQQLAQYLKTEHRLLMVTDWALLNNTKPLQLRRMVIQFFSVAEAAADHLALLHEAYRYVYLPSHSQQGGRCQQPTPEQLLTMATYVQDKSGRQHSEQKILSDLQAIAAYVRRYRLHDFPPPVPVNLPEPADLDLTQVYVQQFLQCLDQAIATVLPQRQAQLTPAKAAKFRQALKLLSCGGLSQGQIADRFEVNQSTIARWLELARLRRDIRLHMIPCLQSYITALADTQTVPQQLLNLDAQLDNLLHQDEVDQATSLEYRRDRSLLSQRICRYLDLE
jgi:hypothetical protein